MNNDFNKDDNIHNQSSLKIMDEYPEKNELQNSFIKKNIKIKNHETLYDLQRENLGIDLAPQPISKS